MLKMLSVVALFAVVGCGGSDEQAPAPAAESEPVCSDNYALRAVDVEALESTQYCYATKQHGLACCYAPSN